MIKTSSYLTTFASQFGRYRLTTQAFEVAPAGDIFKRKVDEALKDLPNLFDKADDNIIVGYNADGRVMQICHQENLTLNKNKCHFRCTGIPFFLEVTSRERV